VLPAWSLARELDGSADAPVAALLDSIIVVSIIAKGEAFFRHFWDRINPIVWTVMWIGWQVYVLAIFLSGRGLGESA